MDRVKRKSVWGLGPEFAEVFVGREAFEGLESSGEVVGFEEVGQVRFELLVGIVKVALDRGILDGSIHALDLSVGPGMVGFGQAVFDSVSVAEPVEGMATPSGRHASTVLGQVCELDAVVGEHGVDAVRNSFDERFKEGGSSPHVGLLYQFDDGELRGPVDGHEQIELAFGGPDLGQVDVKEADRISVKLLPFGLVAFHVRQAADAVTLQAPVK